MEENNWRKILKSILTKTLNILDKTNNNNLSKNVSILNKEIHISTWLVAIIIYLIFFFIFIYEFGFYYRVILGIGLFLLLVMFFGIYFMKKNAQKVIECDDSVTLMGFVLIVSMLLMLFVKKHALIHYIATPIPASVMIINILLGPVAGFIVALVSVITMTIFYQNNFTIFLVMLIGSLTAIIGTINVNHRKDITIAGMYVGVINFISIIILKLLISSRMPNLFETFLWCMGTGFLSGILTIGILPYMESFFSVTTNIRLLELSDFTQPILKKMMMEAPGTYHHSLIVGNLAEAAAREIGANSLLARVASYYHDIGKLDKAEYFSENKTQYNVNKHEDMTPNLSSLVILCHVKDGVNLAKKMNLDKIIVDIIEQHHGTSLMHYFYHKAKHVTNEFVDEQKYRYPGPKPKSKEAAIIMLADCVEASTHTIEDFSHAHLKDLVTKIINNKFVDEQLDECDITLSDLHIIASSFVKTLTGMYHTRVEYPTNKEHKSDENHN
jgi:cyclic-di-AMP phosphodiesterase PgpH